MTKAFTKKYRHVRSIRVGRSSAGDFPCGHKWSLIVRFQPHHLPELGESPLDDKKSITALTKDQCYELHTPGPTYDLQPTTTKHFKFFSITLREQKVPE